MDLDAFRDEGYLQEANRRFFHPLGLAMFVQWDDDGKAVGCGVYDDREDPEGWRFWFGEGSTWPEEERGDAVAKFVANASFVDGEWEARQAARVERLGYVVQPVDRLLTDGPPDS